MSASASGNIWIRPTDRNNPPEKAAVYDSKSGLIVVCVLIG